MQIFLLSGTIYDALEQTPVTIAEAFLTQGEAESSMTRLVSEQTDYLDECHSADYLSWFSVNHHKNYHNDCVCASTTIHAEFDLSNKQHAELLYNLTISSGIMATEIDFAPAKRYVTIGHLSIRKKEI